MVITTTTLNKGNEESMDIFDVITHFAFGTDNTTPQVSDLTLGGEVYRGVVFTSVKDLGDYTYELEGRLPITEGNGVTINEVGVFDAASSGNMGGRVVLPTGFAKTSDDEYLIKIRIKATAINN